jgi:hypothetical protein
MNTARTATLAACLCALLVGACAPDGGDGIVIGQLSQPRGMWLDADELCVAEAGHVDGELGADPGPQIEATTGRIVCSSVDGGSARVIADELPFVYYPDAAVTSGAADVTAIGDRRFGLVGESYGEMSRSIVELDGDRPRVVVDLGRDAESTIGVGGALLSNPYSFVATPDGEGFFVADAATGTVLRAGLDGSVELFAEVPGHDVLTGISWGADGRLYVSSFGTLPHADGSGAVLALDPDGTPTIVLDGLTMVIDVAVAPDGSLLVLEYATPPTDPGGVEAYRDRSGRLLHVPAGVGPAEARVLRDDLGRPTAILLSGDDVFVSISQGELAADEGSVIHLSLGDLVAGPDASDPDASPVSQEPE